MALTIQAVVSLDTRMFTAGIRGIEAQINQFAGLAMMQFGGVAQQIAAMWGAFGPAGAAVSALGAIVQAGASYEQQMARVASYTQATGDTMQRLSSEGAGMAAKFGFSLDQVGQSMASLALAGVEAADMGDVLQASLLLASATLGDANQSAELITSTLKVFQADMAKATSVADLFAGAIASSPLDLQRLSDSMKYAGATGAAFGMNMSQVVSEIAAFHQVGLRGQMAGTSFRGALLEMSAAAASAKGIVGSALQGWVPATEGLTGAVRRLNDAGADASVVIQELGKRAGPGVAALMKLGADAMEDLSGKIRQNSSVTSMHEKQMEALAGQYKLLQGEISSLAKKIFDALSPGLQAALEVVKNAVRNFTEFASVIKGPFSSSFNALLPLFVAATTSILTFNGALKALSFVGVNTGVKSLGDLMRVSSEGAEAARHLTTLKAELNAVEQSIKAVKLAGAGGMIGATDTAALADLTAKADSARAAFAALQAQGARPFIQQATFAAMPRFDELKAKMADATVLARELQQSMWRLKLNPSPAAQAEWKSLAKAYDGCIKSVEGYRREYAKLEAAVGRSGLSSYNAALAESKKHMTAAAAEADKFGRKLSNNGLKTYNATLAETTKRQKELAVEMAAARQAAGFMGTGLSGLQVAISGLGAAMMGIQMGNFVAGMRVWGTDHTVHEWLAGTIAGLIDARAGIHDFNEDVPQYIKDMREHAKAVKEAGQAMADAFVKGIPQSAAWAEKFEGVLSEVDKRTKQLATDLENVFKFGGDTSVFDRLDAMLKELDGFGDVGKFFDASKIASFRQEINGLNKELSEIKSSIASKQAALVAEERKQLEIAAQQKIVEEERKRILDQIDAIKSKKYFGSEKDIRDVEDLRAQYNALGGTLAQLGVAAKAAEDSIANANAELEREKGKLKEAEDGAAALEAGHQSLATAIDDARARQEALNEALARQEAEEAAHDLDLLAAALVSSGMSADQAKTVVGQFGDAWREYVGIAEDAGISTDRLAENVAWLSKNQEQARGILERLGIATGETTSFMVKYGDKCFDVAKRMSQLGESEEEAAQAVGVFGSAAAQATQTLESNTKAIAENRKELFALASISGARLTRLTDNLKQLRDALTPPAGAPAIDLSWMRDLASLTRLPNLGSVDSWLRKFDTFATGVRDICTNIGPNIDFSWVEPIGHFQMPNLDGATGWIKDFKDWASSIRTETPSLERFATILQNLQGSLTALNDATLKIVFKDESLLSRIESHLSTLASLKGVIWA